MLLRDYVQIGFAYTTPPDPCFIDTHTPLTAGTCKKIVRRTCMSRRLSYHQAVEQHTVAKDVLDYVASGNGTPLAFDVATAITTHAAQRT